MTDTPRVAQALDEAWKDPEEVKSAPVATAVARVDEVTASHPRTMAPLVEVVAKQDGGR